MFFTDLFQLFRAAGSDDLCGNGIHHTACALRQHIHSSDCSQSMETPHKLRTGKDRCRRHGNITFRFCLLIKADLSALFQQGIPDQVFIAEFVRKCSRTLRSFFQQILQRSGMSPGKQPVQTADFGIRPVISLRSDHHHSKIASHDPGDLLRDLRNLFITLDLLGITDSKCCKFCRNRFIFNINAGNHKRTEEISLPAFIDPRMGRKRLLFRRKSTPVI